MLWLLLSACAAAQVVIQYDLRYTNALSRADAHEHTHLVTVLGGIVNRGRPRLFTPSLDAACLIRRLLLPRALRTSAATRPPPSRPTSLYV
jgi:hypothetical protein